MRKMRVIIITAVAVILLVGGVLALNLFAFGKVKDVSSIGVQDCSAAMQNILSGEICPLKKT